MCHIQGQPKATKSARSSAMSPLDGGTGVDNIARAPPCAAAGPCTMPVDVQRLLIRQVHLLRLSLPIRCREAAAALGTDAAIPDGLGNIVAAAPDGRDAATGGSASDSGDSKPMTCVRDDGDTKITSNFNRYGFLALTEQALYEHELGFFTEQIDEFQALLGVLGIGQQ
mmetsp:Transcript_77749/g.224781  ORF Transcript_77749/g.224781 Transcript_77749/m.224781 type:complete len:169 (+) Transcript_77749:85-591(+)